VTTVFLRHFVLPKDDTLVPKHVGDAALKLLLIKTVLLVGVINGVLSLITLFELRIMIWMRYISCLAESGVII